MTTSAQPKLKTFTGTQNFTKGTLHVCCEPRTKARQHTEEAAQQIPFTVPNPFHI